MIVLISQWHYNAIMVETRSFNIQIHFSKKLKKIRLENGLSQSELAEQSGVSPKYIYRLESGEANPSIVFVNRLAVALGVPFSYFFKDDEGRNVDFLKS